MSAGAPGARQALPYRTLAFEDLALGQRASLMRTVMDDDLHLFAAVTGDTNPIHTSESLRGPEPLRPAHRPRHVHGEPRLGGDRHAAAGAGRGVPVPDDPLPRAPSASATW